MIPMGILDISADAYHADPCPQPSLSASICRVLTTSSPAHARVAHPRLNPDYQRQEEERFDVGTASHALLLEGEAAIQVIDAPDWRTTAAREAREEARRNRKIPLLAHVLGDVEAMVAATRAQLDLIDADPALFTDGKPERTLVWEEDGVWCRARLDWLRDDYAAVDDFKTTSRSANPEQWSRTIFGAGYDVQAAMYTRAVQAVAGVDAVFRLCVQETFPPYALSVVSLAPDAMALAEAKVERAIATWRECLATGVWPAYPRRVCWAELPGWAESQWLEREAREAA